MTAHKSTPGPAVAANVRPIDRFAKAFDPHNLKPFAEMCGNDQNYMDAVKDDLAKAALDEIGLTSRNLLTRVGA